MSGEDWDFSATMVTSCWVDVSSVSTGFGVYVNERSLLSARARSSFSSSPFVGPRLHLAGLYLAKASLNFLICDKYRILRKSI